MGVTLNDIAEAAGVSRGTVDRALNNRGRIQPQVAEKIRRIAKEMGYNAHIGARALALSGKRYKVGVILQMAETPFMRDVLRGLRVSAGALQNNGINVEINEVQGADSEEVISHMARMRREKTNLIVLVGGDFPALRREIDTCRIAEIPVVTLISDVPHSHRKFFVGQNAHRSGQVAGSVMADLLGASGNIAVVYGLDSSNQSEHVRGFRDVLSHKYPDLHILTIKRTGNDPSTLTKITDYLLLSYPQLDGIYLCSEGAAELCSVLRRHSRAGSIYVIAHDLASCRKEDVLDRTIDYVIDDNGFGQGYYVLRLIEKWAFLSQEPSQEFYYSDIRIVNAFNYESSLAFQNTEISAILQFEEDNRT